MSVISHFPMFHANFYLGGEPSEIQDCSLCLDIGLCLGTLGPAEVLAGREDESDDLPGMDDNGTTTALIIVVVLAGILVYMLVKNSGDDEVSGEDGEKSDAGRPEGEPASAGRGCAGDDPLRPGVEAFDKGCIEGASGKKISVTPVVLVTRDGLGAGVTATF